MTWGSHLGIQLFLVPKGVALVEENWIITEAMKNENSDYHHSASKRKIPAKITRPLLQVHNFWYKLH